MFLSLHRLLDVRLQTTLWKLQDFSITQILREIKINEYRVRKIAILNHFKAYLPNKKTAQFLSLDQACLSYEMVDFHRAAMLQVSL